MQTTHEVFSRGIYHGLPTFPAHEGKKYTALVFGATGITGAYIMKALATSPERWTKIYAVSRRPPTNLPANAQHVAADLLAEPEEVAEKLNAAGVKADYVFFAAYIQPPPKPGQGLWSDAEEMEKVNVRLLSTALQAIKLSGHLPNRFLLQTGGKQYGVHLGPTLTPWDEDDPRYIRQQNFYFVQEDTLFAWCKENNVEWVITRPAFVTGAVKDAAMNVVYGLAIYASVQKELGRKLDFPGNIAAWEATKDTSSAALIGYHAEWAVLTDEAKSQAFNIVDGSAATYGKIWPWLANQYGVEYGIPELEEGKFRTFTMPFTPPPRGFGPPGEIKSSWSFEEWAAEPEVRKAWESLKARYGLEVTRDPFENATDYLGLVDIAVLGPWPSSVS
jgi:nucleoside-diphosphate-sugar epimerase